MSCTVKTGAMLALASTALAAPINRGLGARPPIGGPGDHRRSARAATEMCVGDRETFNPFPDWGTVCSSYAEGGQNRNWCNLDRDANGRSAAEVCFECGACLESATEPSKPTDPLSGAIEASSCNKVWGKNYFGINKELYLANEDQFKVGEAIVAGGVKYYIDAMQIHGNCNSDVALVYVANKPECVDGTPWQHTDECGFGGEIVTALTAGVDSWVLSPDYVCTEEVDFITDAGYSQDTMCGSVAEVMAECKAKCDEIGCTGFFYQEHPNDAGCPSSPQGGYQICGYTTAATFGTTNHGHRAGSQVCTPRP